jgi:uncharacterized protein (DUF433 family)
VTTAAAIKPLSPDDPRVAVARYTILEASSYLGLPYERLRGWVRPDPGEDPLVTAFPKEGHHPVLAFAGFAEAFILSIAYRAGMKPERISANVAAIKAEFKKQGGLDYALASQLLFHDRAELLVTDEHWEHFVVPRLGQLQLKETVERELITYGDDGFATRVVLPKFKKTRVVVDPGEAFGDPIVERTGARVRDVVNLFYAEEEIEDIAYDFDLTAEEVQDLIRAQTKSAT